MNMEKARKLVASENGKKSAEARRKKYGKDFPKVMSDIRRKGRRKVVDSA